MPPPAEGLTSRLILGPALRTQPDRRLVSLVREGYEAAFEEIVRRYGKPLVRYAATIVGGRSEDVTQDAFSKALLALRRNNAEIELRPWLFRIVRNTALNDLRDSPPSPEILAEAIAGGRGPTEELEQREALADLMRRLQALPEPQRAAIVMRELEGLGHEEIAAALGLSGGAARQAIYRARQALRSGLGLLVPLPLLKVLMAAAGTGTVEAAAAASGVGGAAGAGVALKATAATVLVAGAVGAGVVLDHDPRAGRPEARAQTGQSSSDRVAGDAPASPATTVRPQSSGEHRATDEAGDDRGGGAEPADDQRGPGGSPHHGGGGHSGPGGRDDHGGPSHPETSGRSGHDGGGMEDGAISGGERSDPDDGSGSSGGSGSGGDGSHDSGDSGSGESVSGGSGSGDSSDSHDTDGLTEQTTPES